MTSGVAPGDGLLTTDGLGAAAEGSGEAAPGGDPLGDDAEEPPVVGVLPPVHAVSVASRQTKIRRRTAAP